MKNRLAAMIVPLALLYTPLNADYSLDDESAETITENTRSPFTLKISGDWVAQSKHRNHNYKGHIEFNHEEIDLDSVVYYDECYEEGVSLGLAYERTFLHWNDNPFFHRKNYDTFSVALTYFTQRLQGWRWIAQGSFNIDAQQWQFSDYTNFNILLWGRYDYCQDLGLHVGFYAEAGMKLDRVWPIFGIDWRIQDHWTLNLIYPLNISLVYACDDSWSLALAGRIFNERHRAGKSGGFYQAVWRYQSLGGEIVLNNNWCQWLKSNIHIGYTFGGKLKVANRDDKHSHRFKFKSAPYVGGELTASF